MRSLFPSFHMGFYMSNFYRLDTMRLHTADGVSEI